MSTQHKKSRNIIHFEIFIWNETGPYGSGKSALLNNFTLILPVKEKKVIVDDFKIDIIFFKRIGKKWFYLTIKQRTTIQDNCRSNCISLSEIFQWYDRKEDLNTTTYWN